MSECDPVQQDLFDESVEAEAEECTTDASRHRDGVAQAMQDYSDKHPRRPEPRYRRANHR